MANTEPNDRPSEATAPQDAEIARLERRSRHYSMARFFGFLVFVALLFFISSGGIAVAALAGLILLGFVALIVGHEKTRQALRHQQNLRQLHNESQERQRTRRATRTAPPAGGATALEEGKRLFAQEAESFALDDGIIDDLGLLSGPRSLFGWLDLSSTIFGAKRLRYRLANPILSVPDIRERQQLVAELAAREEVRRSLLERLMPLRRHDFTPLYPLFDASGAFVGRRRLMWIAQVLGTIAAGALLGCFIHPAFTLLLVPLLAIHMGIIGLYLRESNPARDRILLFLPLLQSLEEVGGEVRGVGFEAEDGRRIEQSFARVHESTGVLRRYLKFLALRNLGVFFELFNVLTLWELRWLPLAEAELERNRAQLQEAIGALGEIEASLSLATPMVEQPGFLMPEPLTESRPRVEVEELGHPLLESEQVVRNPFELGPDPHVMVVTGSNMAGKSTFLRAIGTNVVMAAVGGPVCAKKFRWTPVALYSDVNVRDSLDDGKSYFQVEVERVLQVLRASEKGPMLLAIFDEVFRGTNSAERLAIAQAILRHMRDCGVLLVVATHDLRLTEMVTVDQEPGMTNAHFQESLEGSEMTFDYKVRPGPAISRNAIRVLEVSGYPESVVREADEHMASEVQEIERRVGGGAANE